jgi:uncharacterized Zn finger protein
MTGCTAADAATVDKAVLFCDSCGYRGTVDSDWIPTGDPHRVRCPACGTVAG